MPLERNIQEDYSVGVDLAVAPHLISDRGAYLIRNGLLGDDGSVFKRGGSVSVSNAAFNESLRGVWEGWLGPGRRTLVASTTNFGVLAEDGETIIDLGGTGFTGVPRVMREIEGMLFIGANEAGAVATIYGGSRKEADYSTGTVTVTKDSKEVTGSGTSWSANVDRGMLFRRSGERAYVVEEVNSDTKLTLRDDYEGSTGSGKSYSLKRLETTTAPYKSCTVYAVAGRRLIVCEGQNVWLSEPGRPHDFTATIQPAEESVDNKHTIPDGVRLLGQEAHGPERVSIFTTHGVWSISNLSHAIVDGQGNPQHRMDHLSRELVLLGNAGITGWRDALIVPCVDDVYYYDGVSEPEPISRSIRPLYRGYVAEGLTVGAAHVFEEHLFLPIIGSTGVVRDMLICRLDRPSTVRSQRVWPWTFGQGQGTQCASVEVRVPGDPNDPPKLFGANEDGMLVDLRRFFTPAADVKADHDESVPHFELVTRDFGDRDLAIVRWRGLRLRYEMEAAEGDSPRLFADIGAGLRISDDARWDEVVWGEFLWGGVEGLEFVELEGGPALANAGSGAAALLVQNAKRWYSAERLRYARWRLRSTDPVAKLTIRGLEVFHAIPGGIRQSKVV